MSTPLKIATYNCRGLRDPGKRSRIFKLLQRYDIILLQETHCASTAEASYWSRMWSSSSLRDKQKALLTTYSSTSVGAGILVNPKSQIEINSSHIDPLGRWCAAHVTYATQAGLPHKLLLVSLYAPNSGTERSAFYTELTALPFLDPSSIAADVHVVIGGDFNCILDPNLDKLGGNPDTGMGGSAEADYLCLLHGTTDALRYESPYDKHFTWRNHDASVATRIDRIHIPDDWSSFAKSVILPITPTISDHALVSVSIDLSSTERGRSYWKLNTSFLLLPPYIHNINKVINDWFLVRDSFNHPPKAWDYLKLLLKTHSKKFHTVFHWYPTLNALVLCSA